MSILEKIRCPNCGSHGERHHILSRHLVRTQCPACDYLLITDSLTGKVVEAYAPGIDVDRATQVSRR